MSTATETSSEPAQAAPPSSAKPTSEPIPRVDEARKLVKRNVSLKVLDASEPRQSGQQSKITINLKDGISSEDAKKVAKLIRDEGPKGIRTQIQGDELRVFSKKRDDLQAVIALVKEKDFDFAVQFVNYR